MAHEVMLAGDGGAAAVLGATTITTFRADDLFASLLQEQLVTPGTPIGVAVLEAKKALAESHPGMREVFLGLTLLGDPTLVVAP